MYKIIEFVFKFDHRLFGYFVKMFQKINKAFLLSQTRVCVQSFIESMIEIFHDVFSSAVDLQWCYIKS